MHEERFQILEDLDMDIFHGVGFFQENYSGKADRLGLIARSDESERGHDSVSGLLELLASEVDLLALVTEDGGFERVGDLVDRLSVEGVVFEDEDFADLSLVLSNDGKLRLIRYKLQNLIIHNQTNLHLLRIFLQMITNLILELLNNRLRISIDADADIHLLLIFPSKGVAYEDDFDLDRLGHGEAEALEGVMGAGFGATAIADEDLFQLAPHKIDDDGFVVVFELLPSAIALRKS